MACVRSAVSSCSGRSDYISDKFDRLYALIGLGAGTLAVAVALATVDRQTPFVLLALLCGMLAAARLSGQTVGAAAVAILFHAYGEAGSSYALMLAALLALTGAAISLLRLSTKSAPRPARS